MDQNRFTPSRLDQQPKGCTIHGMDTGIDDVFKALADPSRRMLLDRLREQSGQTLGELCENLAMSRQAVTKHLVVLEKANLIATTRRGREKLHYLNPVPIFEIADRWIGRFERDRLRVLAELKKNLEDHSDNAESEMT